MRKLLYSNGSPYARRVRIVLLEKKLSFEPDVDDAVRPVEDIIKHNPALQVPVFYDGDMRLFGSNLILQYLFEMHPTRHEGQGIHLAPSIVREHRKWDDQLILTTIEALSDSLVNVRLMTGVDATTVPYLGRQLVRVSSCMDWLEQQVTASGFWPGTFSVMDINLMCPLLYAEKRGVFIFRSGQWPRICEMIDGFQSRSAVASTPVNDWPPRS